jgi:hypothetical protein
LNLNPGPIEFVVFIVVATAVVIWPAWRICSKAGFTGALSLLILIPGLNLCLLFFLALAEWPALRAVQEKSKLDIYPESMRLSNFK